MPKSIPPTAFVAMQLTGDLGGITYVQRKNNRRVAYAKTFPRCRSPKQAEKRDKFAAAMNAWKALDSHHRNALNAITRIHRMPMGGHNLFISCQLNHHMDWIVQWAWQDLGFRW